MNSSEMSCLRSNGDNEIHSSASVRKRFRFPKKFFDECNGVDHASVPRKLRSAIKKRSRQSITPPLPVSKKLNYMLDGAETLRKDVNKSKLKLARRGSNGCVTELEGPITKDEEEVAETLYALAGMIPDTGTSSASKLNSQLSEVKSELKEAEASMIANGVVKEEQEIRTTNSQFNDEVSKQFPEVAVSAGEAAKLKSSEDASQCDTSISTEQLEISLQPIVACGFQANQLNMLKEKRNNGSLLWPGLSAGGSSCSDKLGFSKQYPIAKFPAWFGSTGADAQAQNAESSLPTVKDSQVPLDLRKSFKRCAAHVYISRLIKVLQTAAREDIVSSHPPQSSSHDGSKQGTCLLQNCLTGKVNEMHGIVSTGSVACTSTEKNQTEVRNAILLHQRLLQEQQQASTTSGVNSLVKQNIDFLSLSAGSYVMKGANGANIAGHNLEAPLTSQDHPAMHFLLPQNGYSSTSFRFLPATASAQQVLLPPYLGGASTRPSFAADMTLQSQTLQQNELRNAHFTAQYKFGVSTSQTFSVWQNAGRQMPIFGPSQAQFAASSSMESLSSKLAPVFLSGQELMSISSPRHRGPYYLFPSGYEGNGHGLYPNKVPSLQLLCNGHL
ncbi:uncharacterized protein [Nicotiana sylvestris]|uniref:Uncharacterized protein LOC104229807 n=1 Tax=Nicotiana sylvestris TaxID=4096 RepID=A0A1U7WLI7_NICSY|nr:PREDICTED: uncharacterized protein LOC104229807 [Nicotiana sylvestris]XP_009780826.1 PREDICTED: uncharacterized protein LOC104229807 [Nicotiana sylvestris]XP_009780832.1 PREDICTED: uncharacterized protein LOC104229807 [Nicotiana sylvestris]XP_009780841.1 PREDICTED: uncharacterized protein LOC104229807 [Nicotiana sylvestris]XP_009780850.1 PREDICTED: uncharacterized protein LOC104229807 [Nicotiana sylvestris]XP_009780851.1 PREDICTED: uncharacterized protein LOC104229807 [Nicotiana sylvestris]